MNHRSIFPPSLLALCLASLVALVPALAVAKSETRPVTGFHHVALGVPARLELKIADTEGVSITADDNVLALIETTIENGTLRIRWVNEKTPRIDVRNIDIVVTAKAIDALTVGGSGEIHAERIAAKSFRATISGSGSVTIDKLDADSAKATIAGSARMTAAGRADSLDATLAGSGEIDAAKLATKETHVTIQGSAQATVWAKDSLTATIAGSGEVTYYGKPKVRQTVAGSGTIKSAGDAP